MPLDHIGRVGTKTFSALTFTHPALATFAWPYISIRGQADGPTLCVTAAMHGSEYAGIEAALRLAHDLDPGEVKGHVLVIPVLNQPAFWERAAHVVPLDGKTPAKSTRAGETAACRMRWPRVSSKRSSRVAMHWWISTVETSWSG